MIEDKKYLQALDSAEKAGHKIRRGTTSRMEYATVGSPDCWLSIVFRKGKTIDEAVRQIERFIADENK